MGEVLKARRLPASPRPLDPAEARHPGPVASPSTPRPSRANAHPQGRRTRKTLMKVDLKGRHEQPQGQTRDPRAEARRTYLIVPRATLLTAARMLAQYVFLACLFLVGLHVPFLSVYSSSSSTAVAQGGARTSATSRRGRERRPPRAPRRRPAPPVTLIVPALQRRGAPQGQDRQTCKSSTTRETGSRSSFVSDCSTDRDQTRSSKLSTTRSSRRFRLPERSGKAHRAQSGGRGRPAHGDPRSSPTPLDLVSCRTRSSQLRPAHFADRAYRLSCAARRSNSGAETRFKQTEGVLLAL